MDHGKWEWRRGRNAHGNGRVAQWERDGSGRSSMGGQGTSIYPPGGPAGVPGWTRTAGMEAEGVDGAFIRGPVEAEFESGSRRSRRLSGIGRTWESAKRPRDGNPAAHESPAEPEVEDAFAHPTAPTRSRARRRWWPGSTRMQPRSLRGRKPGDAGWPRVLVYSLPCSFTHPSASPRQSAREIFPQTREYSA